MSQVESLLCIGGPLDGQNMCVKGFSHSYPLVECPPLRWGLSSEELPNKPEVKYWYYHRHYIKGFFEGYTVLRFEGISPDELIEHLLKNYKP